MNSSFPPPHHRQTQQPQKRGLPPSTNARRAGRGSNPQSPSAAAAAASAIGALRTSRSNDSSASGGAAHAQQRGNRPRGGGDVAANVARQNPHAATRPTKLHLQDDDDDGLAPGCSGRHLQGFTSMLSAARMYHASSISAYRATHQTKRDAKDRARKSCEALRAAQAEMEHAATAEEYASLECDRAVEAKDEAAVFLRSVEDEVKEWSGQKRGAAVRLVGLKQTTGLNGRTGRIVSLVTDGEDVGRWRVRLDSGERRAEEFRERGNDPEGRDGRDSENGERPDGAVVAAQHVVAKAENLEWKATKAAAADFSPGPLTATTVATTVAGSRSKSRSRSRSRSHRGEEHHDGDYEYVRPIALTPQRLDPTFHDRTHPHQKHHDCDYRDSSKSNSNHYHDSPSRQDRGISTAQYHPQDHNHEKGSDEYMLGARGAHTHYGISERIRDIDESTLSSAFSTMLTSPVPFEAVSFDPNLPDGQQQSLAGSYFDETHGEYFDPKDNEQDHHRHKHRHDYNHHHHHEHSELHPSPSLTDYITTPPTVVKISTSLDENETNMDAPQCLSVRGAGISHANGTYIMVNQGVANGGRDSTAGAATNPIFFKEGPPTLLEGGRYYDLCIIRIECPDSSAHVIWFLARVSVDPTTTIRVRFSDCYYYCRSRREGPYGGESPPQVGWKVPSLPVPAAAAGNGGGGSGGHPLQEAGASPMHSKKSQYSKYSI